MSPGSGAILPEYPLPEPFDRTQLVVISSIDWGAAWQRHQLFAAQFAAAGHEVFFVENSGFRNPVLADLPRLWDKIEHVSRPRRRSETNTIPERVTVVPPVVLPPTFRWFRRANRAYFVPQLAAQLRELGLRERPIVIAYFPTATALELIERLDPSALVYDCASNFRAHPSAPKDFARQEKALLKEADLVVTDSDFLFEQKRSEHMNVVQIHQGVSEEFFSAKRPSRDFRRFVYYGTWSQDLEPVSLAAVAREGLEVTVSGFLKGDPPPLPEGVRRLAPARREDLVRRLDSFDAFLLPYRLNPFLEAVVPAKIYECLATGKPIIASPLPSLKPLEGLLYLARTPADWARIARDLPKTETPALREARIALAREHTHSREFARLHAATRRAWDKRQAAPAAVRPLEPWWMTRPAQSFLRGFSWLGALYGVAKASTLLTQVAAGRLLGPLDYGRANLVIAVAAFLQILPILGFPLALSKFISGESSESRRRRIVSSTLTAFAAWGALCLVALEFARRPLAARLGMPIELLDHAILFAFATALYTVISSPLLGLRRFAERGLAEALYGLSAPIFLALFYFRGDFTYHAMILTLCLALACGAAYSMWTLRDLLKLGFDRAAFKPVGRYAVVASLNLLTTAFILSPGRLILHHYYTAHDVGVFSAYFTSTAQIALALLTILASVLIPVASDAQGQTEAWRTLRRVRAPLAAGVLALFIATAVAALALFGRQYPLEPRWVLIFASAAALILLHGVAAALFSARDFDGLRVSVAGSLIAGVSNLGLGLILIPRWGITGAGLALVGAYLLGLAYYAAFAYKGRPAHA